MDAISQIRSDTSAINRANSSLGGELGKDEFLRLLVTQLQNQDPVNPMDSSQFASQLAQFNSVEQLINVNDSLTAMAQSQELIGTGLNNTLASSLPGKTVKVATNQLKLDNSREVPVLYELSTGATEVEVNIYNSNGTLVRTETLENKSSGENTYTWDGKGDSGKNLPEGDYYVTVSAKNGENAVEAATYVKGEVAKVKYTSNGVQLLVNGMYVGLGDVEEIGVD
ncbi:flagellar biosynthesis protein FlgD [bacterium]|nr:MAG: flagellar biosynthesis protein FlgD [bacterium]